MSRKHIHIAERSRSASDVYKEIFDIEMINLKMLLRFNEKESMELARDLGLHWGHCHQIRKAGQIDANNSDVEELKNDEE